MMNIEKPEFTEYIKTLADAADMEINDFSQLKEALQKRMDLQHRDAEYRIMVSIM